MNGKLSGKLVSVPVKDLVFASWNPPDRTSIQRLQRLKVSIQKYGLVYPIVKNKENKVCDGHKRTTVARMIGWDTIPALEINGDHAELYGQVNFTQEKLTGNDAFGVYLQKPEALHQNHKRIIETIIRVCGMDSVHLLYQAGLAPGTFNGARKVFKYIDGVLPVKQILYWMVHHKMCTTVRICMEEDVNPKLIVAVISKNRPLELNLNIK